MTWLVYEATARSGVHGQLDCDSPGHGAKREVDMSRIRRISLVAAIVASNIVLALAASDGARAVSITVNTALDLAPNAQGKFPTDGKCSLRAAIRAAETNSNAHDVDCATGLPAPNIDIITLDRSLRGSTF